MKNSVQFKLKNVSIVHHKFRQLKLFYRPNLIINKAIKHHNNKSQIFRKWSMRLILIFSNRHCHICKIRICNLLEVRTWIVILVIRCIWIGKKGQWLSTGWLMYLLGREKRWRMLWIFLIDIWVWHWTYLWIMCNVRL